MSVPKKSRNLEVDFSSVRSMSGFPLYFAKVLPAFREGPLVLFGSFLVRFKHIRRSIAFMSVFDVPPDICHVSKRDLLFLENCVFTFRVTGILAVFLGLDVFLRHQAVFSWVHLYIYRVFSRCRGSLGRDRLLFASLLLLSFLIFPQL